MHCTIEVPLKAAAGPSLESLEIQELISASLAIARLRLGAYRYGSAVDLVLAPDCRWIQGDGMLIMEALSGLILNALQELRGGGRLRLSAGFNGDFIRMKVEDSGGGLDEGLMQGLSHPEPVVPGRGGLFKALMAAKSMGGRLRASRSGLGGAALSLDLPQHSG